MMNDILGDGWMDDSSHTGDILRSTFCSISKRGRERKYQNKMADHYYFTFYSMHAERGHK